MFPFLLLPLNPPFKSKVFYPLRSSLPISLPSHQHPSVFHFLHISSALFSSVCAGRPSISPLFPPSSWHSRPAFQLDLCPPSTLRFPPSSSPHFTHLYISIHLPDPFFTTLFQVYVGMRIARRSIFYFFAASWQRETLAGRI